MDETAIKEEFSRVILVTELTQEGLALSLTANETERAALAKRLGLISLDRLEASVTAVLRGAGAAVHIQFTADVVQSCIVTLEPVSASAADSVELLYLPENMQETLVAAGPREVVVRPDDDDSYQPLIGDTIDLGAAVAEHLALAIDPYLRKPGAAFDSADAEAEMRGKPFAALAALRR